MIPTRRLAAQGGFFKRSAEELGRLSRIDESTVTDCKTFADRAVGGYSTANLDFVAGEPGTNTPPHARFHGSISTKLPENWRVERTGYAAFRNKDRGLWLFGRLYWDVDPYAYLALRIKSDGRRYSVNIQTDSIIETDIHQHRLYTRHHRVQDSELAARARVPGNETEQDSSATTSGETGWETVLLPFNEFVRTNHGYVVEPQTSIIRQRVKSIGIGLTDRIEGPFDLRIHKIWATNGIGEQEFEEERRICGADALPLDEGVRTGWIEK
ncbi:hypothetical protein N7470_002656 [Penicillium chermesinum]|nr:hypothetical protein N7470_002656 [Penicillium chermesinum]